ncbi:hypothetical protein S40288_01238 [Stachybotrys chartarum IBT 40288]|nr:hypothetical protein S40288_01238 [Stachybotrys chartarum IBT 40288]
MGPEDAAPPPPHFLAIQDVLDNARAIGRLINVIGVVMDFRAPIQSRHGADWKCEIRLFDRSIEWDEEDCLSMHIFRPQDQMPDFRCGDVVVIYQAKVQRFGAQNISLCSNIATDIHIYKHEKIGPPPSNALSALEPSGRVVKRKPGLAEHEYVSNLYHKIDKKRLPTEEEFTAMKVQSLNVKDKFRELKDVRDGVFSDILVQLVKDPYDTGDKMTLWVSDYTENTAFHEYTAADAPVTFNEARDGDVYGYTTRFSKPVGVDSGWKGPMGKRSMQITCWEPHAAALRAHEVSHKSWVFLRNVQVKHGHNGINLEGFLREDRGASGIKINAHIVDPATCVDVVLAPRLKSARTREKELERATKQRQKVVTEAALAGQKRKEMMSSNAEPTTRNRKARRKAARAAEEAAKAAEAQGEPHANVNLQVKCENANKLATTIADMLKPIQLTQTIDEQDVVQTLPFINANHRVAVRVIDFRPNKLEDFARPQKRSSECDRLSDGGGNYSESDDSETASSTVAWEWAFCLKLQDMTQVEGAQKGAAWVAVDNMSAQCLLHLDASDLKANPGGLELLRQRLFLLWGNVEECKGAQGQAPALTAITNRPFHCCVRQYGVKVPEGDADKADAGLGLRWERVFALFGTKIVAV